jgi:hypothetical protein
MRIETIVTGTWLGQRVFEYGHGQLTELRAIPASGPPSFDAPVPRPVPYYGQSQPTPRERPVHEMPVPSAPPLVNRDPQNNLHTNPNEGYQARVAPIISRLRAEGVEFDENPRHFNFAPHLANLQRAADPSPALDNTPQVASQIPFQEAMRRRFLIDPMRDMNARHQHANAVSGIRFISDGRTVWNTAVASEPASESNTDLESDSDR